MRGAPSISEISANFGGRVEFLAKEPVRTYGGADGSSSSDLSTMSRVPFRGGWKSKSKRRAAARATPVGTRKTFWKSTADTLPLASYAVANRLFTHPLTMLLTN